MKRLLPGLPLLFTVTNLLAQTATPDDAASVAASPDASAAAAGSMAALLAGGVCTIVPCIGTVAIWLFIALWIMKDAKRRQSPNATLVIVLGWLVPIVGLIVHLATRPKTIPGEPTNPPV